MTFSLKMHEQRVRKYSAELEEEDIIRLLKLGMIADVEENSNHAYVEEMTKAIKAADIRLDSGQVVRASLYWEIIE